MGGLNVFMDEDIALAASRRRARAPLQAGGGRQAGGMSARASRAPESSSQTSWLPHTAQQCCEQAQASTAVFGIDESMIGFVRTALTRKNIIFMPTGRGSEVPWIITQYNSSFGGIDHAAALRVPERRWQPEDVLR